MPDTLELLKKIQALPPDRLGEVENFVDFISAKARRRAALDRLLEVAPALEAAGVSALTESEIQTEIDAVRKRRNTRSGREGRS